MQIFICFKFVMFVLIIICFDQGFGLCDLFFDELFVVVEEIYVDYCEDEVDFGVEDVDFFKDVFVGGDGFVLLKKYMLDIIWLVLC